MQILKLEDVVYKYKAENEIIKLNYLDYSYNTNPLLNSYPPEMSINVKEMTITIKDKYPMLGREIVDEFLLDLHIKKLIENFTTEHDNIVEIQNLTLTEPEKRKLQSRSVMFSNIIAMEGRIGQADSIIVPRYLRHVFKDLPYNVYIHDGLVDKVILFRKPEKDTHNKYIFSYTDSHYSLDEVGDFSKQYNILEIKCVKLNREKKLKRILQ